MACFAILVKYAFIKKINKKSFVVPKNLMPWATATFEPFIKSGPRQ